MKRYGESFILKQDLMDSLSQISNDNPIKIVLVRLCETIEELQS